MRQKEPPNDEWLQDDILDPPQPHTSSPPHVSSSIQKWLLDYKSLLEWLVKWVFRAFDSLEYQFEKMDLDLAIVMELNLNYLKVLTLEKRLYLW